MLEMKKSDSWFSVSKEGLKALQLGKPKYYVLRELVQNVFDEPTTICNVRATWEKGYATISVTDNSPIGFRKLSDAYTLFDDTYKRRDPTKRGRWNVGEKQVFSICTEAKVETTKGTIIFNRNGRRHSRKKRPIGTKVTIKLKITKKEYEEALSIVKTFIVPDGIKFTINDENIPHIHPLKTIEDVKLTTEIDKNGILTKTQRKTHIDMYNPNGKAKLYEMGIPVMEIPCEYDIDILQKIPMSIDRETVSEAFLQDVFAEVLNVMHEEIEEENISDTWVRVASEDERVSKDAVKSVIKKRFGDKVVVATPNDPISIDNAIASGYNVIRGNQLSGAEWLNVRKHDLLQSSSEMFGVNFADAEIIVPTEDMKKVANLTKSIAKLTLNIDVSVRFVKSKATEGANYGNRCLTFNVSRLGKSFFDEPVSVDVISLIIHEISHEYGLHTEKSYHRTLTDVGASLIILALEEPEFFKDNKDKEEETNNEKDI